MLARLAAMLLGIASHFVGKVVGFLGIAFVTYKGIDTTFLTIRDYVGDRWGGVPSDILNIAGLLGVDTAMTVIISAYIGAVSFALAMGAATRVLIKE